MKSIRSNSAFDQTCAPSFRFTKPYFYLRLLKRSVIAPGNAFLRPRKTVLELLADLSRRFLPLALLLCLHLPLVWAADAVVPPETDPWEYNLCRDTFWSNSSTARAECTNWYSGEWVDSSCVNQQTPRPWLVESEILEKAKAYNGGSGAHWDGDWLAPGETLNTNGACWGTRAHYALGVERGNYRRIQGQNIDVSLIASRSRTVSCLAGSRQSGN